jgi:hypothetical protein
VLSLHGLLASFREARKPDLIVVSVPPAVKHLVTRWNEKIAKLPPEGPKSREGYRLSAIGQKLISPRPPNSLIFCRKPIANSLFGERRNSASKSFYSLNLEKSSTSRQRARLPPLSNWAIWEDLTTSSFYAGKSDYSVPSGPITISEWQ